MKTILLILIVLSLSGCVNTQIKETITEYSNDKIVKVISKEYPAPHAVKSIWFGLKIGVDVETKIPIVWFGILKREYIVGNDKSFPYINDNYEDINLLLGSGSSNSTIEIKAR
jgi:hypothetical protein